MSKRYLTKSRFKLAVECPTKLYYAGKENEYKNNMQDDTFLQMLADGGYQVGALAKLMYPTGYEITSKNHDEAEAETNELLKQDEVVLFEPAIRFGDLFIRIDILVKHRTFFELIEVKSKSYDSRDPKIEGASGIILADMLPYLHDVAFQTYVLRQAHPNMDVSSFLMMPDKAQVATINGLNQMFKIVRTSKYPKVVVNASANKETVGESVLALVNVDEWINRILGKDVEYPGGKGLLPKITEDWATAYKNDTRIPPSIGSHCTKCEFRADLGDSLKSGFHECWKLANNWSDKDFEGGTVLDLWNFRGKDRLIEQNVLKLSQVTQDDLKYKTTDKGLGNTERQWMQARGIPEDCAEQGFYVDRHYAGTELRRWKFPYHMIDFETATMALPFHKGRRPYEPVAFQFSHHIMEESGEVRHETQFLEVKPGAFPNYEFARALKDAIGADDGSVFMWHHHENTILTSIARQLRGEDIPPPDTQELIVFLESILKEGDRAMIDLCVLAKKGFFYPGIKGSSSIKKVLPAVLKISPVLKQKYSQPVYGAQAGIKSQNFTDFVWWGLDASGNVVDPYDKLSGCVDEMLGDSATEFKDIERFNAPEISEGGAAAAAYARLQLEDLSPTERKGIEHALLRYCELDTLAMVMIVEAWRELFNPKVLG